METYEVVCQQLRNELRKVKEKNKAIAELQAERDNIIDPLVKRFGAILIDKLYGEIELVDSIK